MLIMTMLRNGKLVGIVDGTKIFEDKEGFYIVEHYRYEDNVRTVETSLCKTKKDLEKALADVLDWNYRAWHGEMKRILQAIEDVRKIRSSYERKRKI